MNPARPCPVLARPIRESNGKSKSYIRWVFARSTGGILTKISANLGLDDFTFNAVARKKVLRVGWPRLSRFGSRHYYRSAARLHIIKLIFVWRSPGGCISVQFTGTGIPVKDITFSSRVNSADWPFHTSTGVGIGYSCWFRSGIHSHIHGIIHVVISFHCGSPVGGFDRSSHISVFSAISSRRLTSASIIWLVIISRHIGCEITESTKSPDLVEVAQDSREQKHFQGSGPVEWR